MIIQQVLKSIECAIAHRCPNDDVKGKRCAQCEIGYSFIACEPIVLDCGHHICRECDQSTENETIVCQFCEKNVKLTGSTGVAAETVFQFVSLELAKQLKDKFATGLNIYDGKFKILLQ